MSTHIENFVLLLRRYPYSAGCALAALLLGLAAWYLSGQNEELAVAQADRTKEGEAMLSLLVGGSTQRQELAAAHDIARRIEENLVIEENIAENYWYFYKLEEQTSARLPELHQLSSPPTDTSPLFKRVPYTLRATGNYEQVSSFLLALETGPRLVNIIAFNLARTGANGGGLVLDLSIELLGKK